MLHSQPPSEIWRILALIYLWKEFSQSSVLFHLLLPQNTFTYRSFYEHWTTNGISTLQKCKYLKETWGCNKGQFMFGQQDSWYPGILKASSEVISYMAITNNRSLLHCFCINTNLKSELFAFPLPLSASLTPCMPIYAQCAVPESSFEWPMYSGMCLGDFQCLPS